MVAAFNMNNKKTGRLVMKKAEKVKLIPWEQGGARKDHVTAYSLVDKVLSMDAERFRRLPSSVVSCNTKSCHDGMVLWVAALVL